MTTEKDITPDQQKPKHLEKLENYVKEQQAKVTIDDTNVQAHFIVQAPNYLAAYMKFHKAQQIVQNQKQMLDKVMATVDFEIRNCGEKTTEAFIGQSIKRDDRVQKAKSLVIQAEYQSNCYQAVVRSWEQKKDMLIQIGSDQRKEYNSQVSINRSPNENNNQQLKTVNGRETAL